MIAVVILASGGKPGGVLGPSTPAGYTAVRESDGGFAIFLPGDAKKVNATVNGQNASELGHYGWAITGEGDSGKQASAWSKKIPATGFNPATDPEALMQLLKQHDNRLAANNDGIEVVSKKPVTLGGKPGLEVKYKEKARIWSKPGDDGFWAEKDREERERVAREGHYTVIYITHNGKQVFTITVGQKREFPADDVLKTIADSFSFL